MEAHKGSIQQIAAGSARTLSCAKTFAMTALKKFFPAQK